jgi:Zn-dependent peptidase ImmA (M78 family)/integrase
MQFRVAVAPALALDRAREVRMSFRSPHLIEEAVTDNHKRVGRKTLAKYEAHLEHFDAFLASSQEVGILDAQRHHVLRYLDHLAAPGGATPDRTRKNCEWCRERGYPDGRSTEGWSPSTRKSNLSALRFFYRHCLSHPALPDVDPSANIDGPKMTYDRGFTPTPEEVQRFLDAPGRPKDRLLAFWMYYAPSRRETFRNARWKDIEGLDTANAHWRIPRAKGGKPDSFHLHPILRSELRRYRQWQLDQAEKNPAIYSPSRTRRPPTSCSVGTAAGSRRRPLEDDHLARRTGGGGSSRRVRPQGRAGWPHFTVDTARAPEGLGRPRAQRPRRSCEHRGRFGGSQPQGHLDDPAALRRYEARAGQGRAVGSPPLAAGKGIVRSPADIHAMRLEVDPVRMRSLRTRLDLPVEAAARLAGVDSSLIERLEGAAEAVDLVVLRKLAKGYRRNWYVFLLEDEPGRPALPRDFRTLVRGRTLTTQTLAAFDDAEFLIEKILDLPRPGSVPTPSLPSIAGLEPEAAASSVRIEMGITLDDQKRHAAEYDAIRFWSTLVAQAGVYGAQLSFPYREVRAFCLLQHSVPLIVVSSQDSPRARVFSLLHELGHLLLGGDAMCRPRSDDTRSATGNEEAFCNAFAAAMLMPSGEFAADPLARAMRDRTLELGDAVELARRYGVSELAVLRRLMTIGYLSEENYQRLHNERAEEFADEPRPSTGLRIRKQPTRMINENSRLYAGEVLDAHARGDISFREVGVLLGGNLKHVPAIREELGR